MYAQLCRHRLAGGIQAFLFFFTLISVHAQVVPPNAIVAGRSMPEWTAEWWKWIVALPMAENPWLQGVDSKASHHGTRKLPVQYQQHHKSNIDPLKNQAGPVVFLVAMVFPGEANRSVTIEEGTYFFFPFNNFLNNSFGDDPWGTVSEEQRNAGMEYSLAVDKVEGSLNGTPLTNLFYTTGQPVTNLFAHRQISPEFSIWLPPADNIYQYFDFDIAGTFDPAYSDGFWVMLAPLPVGEHELRIKGHGGVGDFSIEVVYHLKIIDLDLSRAVEDLLTRVSTLSSTDSALQSTRSILTAAEKLFRTQKIAAGIDRVREFGRAVRLEIEPRNEPLASDLYYGSQRILNAAMRQLGDRSPPSPFESGTAIEPAPLLSTEKPLFSPMLSERPREDFWNPDGAVHTILATNGLVYLGGSFNSLSRQNVPTAAGFDFSSASLDPDFPVINGAVHSIISDGEGGWFMGGEFSLVSDLPRANLVHLRADKTVDTSWHADTDGAVLTLALSTNILYIGGSFETIGGESRTYIASVSATTGSVTPWHPALSNSLVKPNPLGVCALVVARGLIYIAGGFTDVHDKPRENLAALDPTTGEATDWHPVAFEFTENT
jgi:hypothetical protein